MADRIDPALRMRKPAMEGFSHIMVGDVEVLVLSAGPLPIGTPGEVFASPADGTRIGLLDDGDPSRTVVVPQNVLALRRGDRLSLLDAGSSDQDVPGGALEKAMDTAGLECIAVDTILVSHAHRDHVGGILRSDGSPRFPSATIRIHSADLEFWLSDDRLGTPRERSARQARRTLGPQRDRIRTFDDGDEPFPGVTVVRTRGHTPGHSSFLICSGGRSLFVAGDLVHHPCQLECPEIGMRFDIDMKEGTRTRRRILTHLALNAIPTFFYHLPSPCLGIIEIFGGGFQLLSVENQG